MTTPLVALQKPKTISPDAIETELAELWFNQSGEGSPVASRATTFSIVVYEPEEFQQLLAVLGFYDGPIDGIHGPQTKNAVREAQKAYSLHITGRVDPLTLDYLRQEFAKQPAERTQVTNPNLRGFSMSDAIAAQNPCRIITLCPVFGNESEITAQVSAYCPIQKTKSGRLICCEYITLRGSKSALQQASDLVIPLMIPDLPKFIWWKATPNPEEDLFRELIAAGDCLILDSSFFGDPEAEFLKISNLISEEKPVADLNWHRLSPWQELAAAAFDPPERRSDLVKVDQVTIDYEKGNSAQALMFLGWLASRLDWQPIAYTEMGGDYDLKHIRFTGPNQITIEVELAAIPTADWGEATGDLVGLKLNSSDLNANCCTILCSETTGCMRMEAGGTAHACRTEQVTALSGQKAEFMLSQQLQRWGRDALYEESLAITAQILQLKGKTDKDNRITASG